MNYFLFLIMLLFAAYGVLALFFPAKEKKFAPICVRWLPDWGWGIVQFALAFLLWISADSAAGDVFVKFLAVAVLIKGIMFLSAPKEKIESLINWWTEAPPVMVRFGGALSFVVAFFLFGLL